MESEILNGEFGSDAFNFSSFWRPHWFPLLPSPSPAPSFPKVGAKGLKRLIDYTNPALKGFENSHCYTNPDLNGVRKQSSL